MLDRQISSALIILKLSYFGKSDSWKMVVYKFLVRGIKNWFLIHESQSLNSNPEYIFDVLFQSSNI